MQVLGNYEFDNNIEGFLLFFQNVNFIIFSLNINLDLDFRIKLYVKKSYVIEVGGEKIGVIGYIIKDMFMIFQLGKQYLKGVGQCFFFIYFRKQIYIVFCCLRVYMFSGFLLGSWSMYEWI